MNIAFSPLVHFLVMKQKVTPTPRGGKRETQSLDHRR
jgi:hypothetical protein